MFEPVPRGLSLTTFIFYISFFLRNKLNINFSLQIHVLVYFTHFYFKNIKCEFALFWSRLERFSEWCLQLSLIWKGPCGLLYVYMSCKLSTSYKKTAVLLLQPKTCWFGGREEEKMKVTALLWRSTVTVFSLIQAPLGCPAEALKLDWKSVFSHCFFVCNTFLLVKFYVTGV